MSEYTKFRIAAWHDHTSFRVEVKGWFGWKSGFIWTEYFAVSYKTEEAAKAAILAYKERLKEYG